MQMNVKIKEIIKYSLLALLTSMAFCLNIDHVHAQAYALERLGWNTIGSFEGFRLTDFASILLAAWAYKLTDEKLAGTYKPLSLLIPAIFLSATTVFGLSFAKTSSWQLVMSMEDGQIIKAAAIALGYCVMFYYLLQWIYFAFDVGAENWGSRKDDGRSIGLMEKHPFFIVFAVMFLAYLPSVLLNFPVRLMGDSYVQVVQGYRELGLENLSTHHPLIHTAMIHGCIELGRRLFGSGNAGLFLYSLVQVAIVSMSMAYAISVVRKKLRVPDGWLILAMVYFALHPRIRSYVVLMTKDVIYSALFLCFITTAYFFFTEDKLSCKQALAYVAFGTGMLLFRNESKYVLLTSMLVFALLSKHRRKYALMSCVWIVAVSFLYSAFLIPVINAEEGSLAEMLSVPFQQTARYVRDCGDEVTAEERAAISAVLDYDSLAEKYRPNLSDNVKNTFNRNVNREQLLAYFRVWAKMFVKHPTVYLQATMNNYYEYYWLGNVRFEDVTFSWSQWYMNNINEALAPLQIDFSYNKNLENIRTAIEFVRERFGEFPIVNLFMGPAIYSWTILLMIAHGVASRKFTTLYVSLIPLFSLLAITLGPCNGSYCRYSLPFIFALPVMLFLYTADIQRSATVSK